MIYINDLIRGFTARLGHSAYAAPLPGCTRPSGNLESQTGAGRSPLWVKAVILKVGNAFRSSLKMRGRARPWT
jgi:hypothetical protein